MLPAINTAELLTRVTPSVTYEYYKNYWLDPCFIFFALTHLLGMIHVVKQWESLNEAMKYKLITDPALSEKIDFAIMAPQLIWIVPFHLGFDGFVLLAVWWQSRGWESHGEG